MDAFFKELKQAREAKHFSLADIADATLINVKYLEQIEAGNTAILPQTYIRAFIREYAAIVGLDPDDVMRRYDLVTAPPVPDAVSGPTEQVRPRTVHAPVSSPTLLRWVFGGLAILGAVIILWASLTRESREPVQETPFQKVITENESRLAPAPVSQSVTPQPAAPSARTDSLTLRAAFTDTVWLRVSVDENPPREYIFRPNGRAVWKARERFTVTIGNAGAAQFTLNQKQIGALGLRGNVARGVQLTRETLKQN